MGLNPGRKILTETSPGKGVAAGAQGGNKERYLSGLAGNLICHGDRLSGIIDKELFPGPVRLAKSTHKMKNMI